MSGRELSSNKREKDLPSRSSVLGMPLAMSSVVFFDSSKSPILLLRIFSANHVNDLKSNTRLDRGCLASSSSSDDDESEELMRRDLRDEPLARAKPLLREDRRLRA